MNNCINNIIGWLQEILRLIDLFSKLHLWLLIIYYQSSAVQPTRKHVPAAYPVWLEYDDFCNAPR